MNLLPEQDLYSEILPGLWQGGTHDFDTLEFAKYLKFYEENPKFDSVVTLYAVAHPVTWGVKEFRYGFPDSALEDQTISKVIEMAQWAYSEWKSGNKVLVRCQAGWNRSGLVVALVLIKSGYSAKEAIELIRRKRSPHALCNLDFVRWLESFEFERTS